jgi:hypothetical protein
MHSQNPSPINEWPSPQSTDSYTLSNRYAFDMVKAEIRENLHYFNALLSERDLSHLGVSLGQRLGAVNRFRFCFCSEWIQ